MAVQQQETWWIIQVAYTESAKRSPMDRHPQLPLGLHTHTHTHTHKRDLPWFASGYFSYSTPGYFPIPLQSSYPFCDRIMVVYWRACWTFFHHIGFFKIKIVRKLQLLSSPDRAVELWNLPWVHYTELTYLSGPDRVASIVTTNEAMGRVLCVQI
jgi:hypothetical protein